MPDKPPCLIPLHAARPRRAVLAAVFVPPMSALGGQPPGPGPDQRLLALCNEALAADAAAVARDDEDHDLYGDLGPMRADPDEEVRAWRARLRAISHLPALTEDGLRAKARLLLSLQPRIPDDNALGTLDGLTDEGAEEDTLLLSLLTDILRSDRDPGSSSEPGLGPASGFSGT